MVDVLLAAGVTDIYGQRCTTVLFLAAEKAGIRQIGYRTEHPGIAMADGAARLSRKISVITPQVGQKWKRPSAMASDSVPAKTRSEFIAYANANPNRINYATTGTGGSIHLTTEQFSN